MQKPSIRGKPECSRTGKEAKVAGTERVRELQVMEFEELRELRLCKTLCWSWQ